MHANRSLAASLRRRHPLGGARALFALATFPPAAMAGTAESIEFVAEHLPEIAMDHRYAALPLWLADGDGDTDRWLGAVTAGYSESRSGGLTMSGPMLSWGLTRPLRGAWHLDGMVFVDDLRLRAAQDQRPLDVFFVRNVPLALPAAAEFADLSGTLRHVGLGLSLRHATERRVLGAYQWTAGLLWQQLTLRDYRLGYRILDGASRGVSGSLDYSATYAHVTPFIGIAWPRQYERWEFMPHLQLAMPLPRRGVAGRISGPGFSLQGDTDSVGNGKHFGDPSLTIGYDITYRPWNLTVDVGSAISQLVLEPLVHEGVNQNWLISARWTY